jgi:hypothetical protein
MSDWEKISFTPQGKPAVTVQWHRSDFHGDARVDVKLAAPPPAGAELGLILNGNGADLAAGYAARLTSALATGAKKPTQTVELLKSGKTVSSAPLPWDSGPMLLSLCRTGRSVALCAHEEPLISCADETAAPKHRIGWYAVNAGVANADVDIYTDHLIDYTFNAAPTDWRVGAGIWEVTNRWQCDPRWSFFSGRLNPGAAVLWNKRPLRGDFTIEYYIGNKMDSSRGGKYEYAQDMNITVCADGNDLTSGYSFIFGGFNNTVTCAYRRGERWAVPERDKEILIDRANLHRKWYHVAITRRGSTMEMRVDDKLVLSANDVNPLTGGYWALWTHDNGIMVARVRVAADEIGLCESPDLVRPPAAQTIYAD